uniref:Uncharacterized protein n=1 Tax=Lutzomyia longipalpis TaxID=7200 RepID=A0A1B0CKP9_LUTLO
MFLQFLPDEFPAISVESFQGFLNFIPLGIVLKPLEAVRIEIIRQNQFHLEVPEFAVNCLNLIHNCPAIGNFVQENLPNEPAIGEKVLLEIYMHNMSNA